MSTYNYYPSNSRITAGYQTPQPSYNPSLKGHPVSSLEEVRATAIDFDGSIFYFPSLANDKIYTKQINMDGTSTVRMYELTELPVLQPITQNFSNDNLVTKDEFVKTIEELTEQINQLKKNPIVENTKNSILNGGAVANEQTQQYNF